jgi:hypothetical protein
VAGITAVSIFLFFPETRYLRTYGKGLDRVSDTESIETPRPVDEKNVALQSSPASHTSEIPKKSFLQELKPWSSIHPDSSFIGLLLRPWPLIVYPAVIYSFATFSSTQAWAICLLNTHASIFQRPPYNMSPGINSSYLYPLLGLRLGRIMEAP